MRWIIVSDKHAENFDLDGALHDCGVYWKQNNKFQVGDIVYIYESRPEQYIKYKCLVTATDVHYATFYESEYGGAEVGERIFPSYEIQLEYEFVNPVTLKEMVKYGVSPKRIPVMRETAHPELFEFLEEYEIEEKETGQVKTITEEDLNNLPGAEREAVIKVRVNQGDFRQSLLKKYSHCCLCSVSNPGLLTASHIKPWVNCESEEKTDSENGLLLCPNHDRLFDRGYISFDGNGKIMVSDQLSETDRASMNIPENTKIKMSREMKAYMKYHRENCFKK